MEPKRNVVYAGRRIAGVATVIIEQPETRGLGRPLNPRLDLANKSPTGFEWGYAGSGPSQLALAILADHFGHRPHFAETMDARKKDPHLTNAPDELAYELHQQFKFDFIARIEDDTWETTTKQVRDWCLNA